MPLPEARGEIGVGSEACCACGSEEETQEMQHTAGARACCVICNLSYHQQCAARLASACAHQTRLLDVEEARGDLPGVFQDLTLWCSLCSALRMR